MTREETSTELVRNVICQLSRVSNTGPASGWRRHPALQRMLRSTHREFRTRDVEAVRDPPPRLRACHTSVR
jgi:hypothetical protein